jgi:hypothetical protein
MFGQPPAGGGMLNWAKIDYNEFREGRDRRMVVSAAEFKPE